MNLIFGKFKKNFNRTQLLNSKAFTLIELSIVIVITGILSTVCVIKLNDVHTTAQIKNVEIELSEIMKAIMGDAEKDVDGFYQHMHRLPASLPDDLYLIGTMKAYDNMTNRGWNGPYIGNDDDFSGIVDADEVDDILKDPWRSDYKFSITSSNANRNVNGINNTFNKTIIRIYSVGPNQVDDGATGDDIVLESSIENYVPTSLM